MASVRTCLCKHRGWGTVLLFTYFYSRPRQTAPACYSGKGRMSRNTTISAFYRTHKLRFNVSRTCLCLIIRNKIGLYLLPLTHIALFKWNHLTVTSFSSFNNRVIYFDFLFNDSTFQHLKVSRHIISASTHFYMPFEVQVSSLMALISIHQSFHFKTAHLIFKYL